MQLNVGTSDKKQYRLITLDNGLECLLIHEPPAEEDDDEEELDEESETGSDDDGSDDGDDETQRAACAVVVGVGCMSVVPWRFHGVGNVKILNILPAGGAPHRPCCATDSHW